MWCMWPWMGNSAAGIPHPHPVLTGASDASLHSAIVYLHGHPSLSYHQEEELHLQIKSEMAQKPSSPRSHKQQRLPANCKAVSLEHRGLCSRYLPFLKKGKKIAVFGPILWDLKKKKKSYWSYAWVGTSLPVQIIPLPHFQLSIEQGFIFYQCRAHTSEAYLKCKTHVARSDIQQIANKNHSSVV